MVTKKLLNLSIVPIIGTWGIRLLGKMMALATVGAEKVDGFIREQTPIIIAFWHGRQLLMPLAYRGKTGTILISQHRDGEIIARIMRNFGFGVIRGSTTRGGFRAVREILRAAKQRRDLIVTPDGPRGPACRVQPGVIFLAKTTGFPIVPLTFACSKKKSCRAGIAFKFPTPVGMDFLCGVTHYG